jgi:hypothetical protein
MIKYLSDLTDDKVTNYSLWKVTKRMKRPRLHNPPIRTPERTWAKDNQQKAEAFVNYLEKFSNQAKIKTNHSYWNK